MQLFCIAKDTLMRPETLCRFPIWSWVSSMGAVTYHAPARTGEPVVGDPVISDNALSTTGHIKQMPRSSSKPVDLSKPSPELNQLHLFFSTSALSLGSISPRLFYIFGDAGGSESLGWVSFEEGVVPGMVVYMGFLFRRIRWGEKTMATMYFFHRRLAVHR
jgi:hypothetical protein